jgi:hypothetical protein
VRAPTLGNLLNPEQVDSRVADLLHLPTGMVIEDVSVQPMPSNSNVRPVSGVCACLCLLMHALRYYASTRPMCWCRSVQQRQRTLNHHMCERGGV